ncbi:MAG: phosphate acyltransferase PlsX [Chloroflexota bacterium]
MTEALKPAAIAVDAMGGDHAPSVVIAGAIEAVQELNLRVALVGPDDVIRTELKRHGADTDERITIVPASEVIEMAEHPANAVRQKTDSSIVVGMRQVKAGSASAFVSAGNTGAMLAAGLFHLGRIPGIERPALATVFPTRSGFTLIVDVGANADCKPEYLAQFGVMGAAYAEQVLAVSQPRVGLLSIGEEEGKGNQLAQRAFGLLREQPINFIGNVEGKDIPAGAADVVVCDGFVGNVLIKFAEGVASTIVGIMREEITANPFTKLLAAGLRPAFRRAQGRMDYADFGGAPLLGVQGVVIIAHGRSNSRAIRSAIRVAARASESNLVETIKQGLGSRG